MVVVKLVVVCVQFESQELCLCYMCVVVFDDGVISVCMVIVGVVVLFGIEFFKLICKNCLEWCVEMYGDVLFCIQFGQVVCVCCMDGGVVNGCVCQVVFMVDVNMCNGFVYVDLLLEVVVLGVKVGMYFLGDVLFGDVLVVILLEIVVFLCDGYDYVMVIGQ